MIHSLSTVVLDVLESLSERGLNVDIITTEARPSHSDSRTNGQQVKDRCDELDLKCEVIPDSAVAIHMASVDCVLVGCEAVLSNGGIVNQVGTYSVALIASHFQKPVYVFCQSYKFMQEFPLGQEDVFEILERLEDVDTHNLDYTPPQHVELFFTDLGIFTASGISDELTQFFSN
jgi:translation initiation factor eIF-2B subunit alpha